jgi:phosphate transport system substrate-binding protein
VNKTITCRRDFLAGSAALTAVALAAGCSPNREWVRTSGASTTLPVFSHLGSEFERLYPTASVSNTGGGSTKGLEDVAQGHAHIGGLVRELTPQEHARVNAIPLATNGIAIIGHRDLGIDALSLDDLRGIYSGGRARAGRAGRLLRIGKSSTHGTFVAFASGLGLPESRLEADAIGASNGEVIALVAAQPLGIGYVSWADAREAVRSGLPIKILTVEGVVPTLDTIASGQYPLSHRIYIVIPKDGLRGAPALFLALLQGTRGAAALRNAGLPPLGAAHGAGTAAERETP